MSTISEKQGYKYTEEFGYIPEDWNVMPLEDYISNKKYAIVDGPFGSNLKTEHYRKSGVPIVQSGFVTSNAFKAEEYLYVDKEKFQKEIRSKVEAGDIVMAKIGANCGTCAILPKEHPTSILAGNSLKISVDKNSTEYLLHLFHRMLPLNMMEEAISRTAQPALSVGRLKKLKILVPPLPEQEKIAEVFGDIDSLIDKTQQLINKKKDLKTATMQKYVYNRKDTNKAIIGNLFNIGRGRVISKMEIENNNGIYPVYSSQTTNNGILGYINTYDFEGDYLTWTTDGANAGQVFYRRGKFNCTNVCGTVQEIVPNSCNLYYVMTFLNSVTKNYVSYVGNPKLMNGVFSSIEIELPPKDEQDKIATILSDMDSEIEALEKELNKYKDLKTGMMQQLLTGKIRLLGKSVEQDDNVVSIEDVATHKVANDEFKDAILISVLAYRFGNERYPLGAFRRQKLSYFYKRHANMNIDEYTKKAMGPYNSKIKYQGAENIAIRNGYVKNVGGRGIVATNLISKAEEYYNRYYKPEDMQWLDANFHYENNNNLEVLATVDYAINDLVNQNKAITLANIKTYIASDEEWRPKLELDYFTDNAIIKAMEKIKKLFNSY